MGLWLVLRKAVQMIWTPEKTAIMEEKISILETVVRYVSISHWGQFPFVRWDDYNHRWIWLDDGI